MNNIFENCTICPRECGVNRNSKELGYCRSSNGIYASKAYLHMWEEPCISGKNGSGTVFFSGCNLGCVYCQNSQISRHEVGKKITTDRLCEIFFELKNNGAHNINLVTATHILPLVLESVKKAKKNHIDIPFIYNCGGYEKVNTLKEAKGLIDIYLTDFKYMSEDLAKKYSNAADYPTVAKSALFEMVLQKPLCIFDSDGMMISGVLVRHMMLPKNLKDSKAIINYLYSTYGDKIYLSLMSQYTPTAEVNSFPELCRTVQKKEYDRLIDYALSIGVTQAFIQEGKVASESFIPDFDGFGI